MCVCVRGGGCGIVKISTPHLFVAYCGGGGGGDDATDHEYGHGARSAAVGPEGLEGAAVKVPPGALEHEAREVGALLGRRRDVACLGLLGHLAKDKGQRRRPNEEGYCATPPLVCDTLTSIAEATKI